MRRLYDANKPRNGRIAGVGAAGALLAVAIAGGAVLAQGAEDAASGPGGQELTLEATDYAFDFPETVEAGRVVVTMVNDGADIHHAQLLKLHDGVTLQDVEDAAAALETDPQAELSQVDLDGGPGIILPGASQRVVLDLAPGTYVWLCGIPAADGVPHFEKGMIRQFEVLPAGAAAEVPPALPTDEIVTMKDFAYDIPSSIPTGPQRWQVVNDGNQPHEMLLARLAPGATAEDFAMAMADPAASGGPPPGVPMGGSKPSSPAR